MVKCSRTECPPLDCDEKVAIRRTGCCKVCPVSTSSSPSDPSWLGDQQSKIVRTKSEILAAGGCNYPVGRVFENGEEWHPRVYSHGEVKSVKCHCKVKLLYYCNILNKITMHEYFVTTDMF